MLRRRLLPRLVALGFAVVQAGSLSAFASVDAWIAAAAVEVAASHAESPGTKHRFPAHLDDCALCAQIAALHHPSAPTHVPVAVAVTLGVVSDAVTGALDAGSASGVSLPRAPPGHGRATAFLLSAASLRYVA